MNVVSNTGLVAGADGCRGGWVVVGRRAGEPPQARVWPTLAALWQSPLRPRLLLVDIPIGLPDSGARQCDRAARRMLGRPRMASVFTAPIRPVLAASSWAEASGLRRSVEDKGMAQQAWGIVAKVAETDTLVRGCDPQQRSIREAHPEVSFSALAGRPMMHPKRRRQGREERAAVLDEAFGAGCCRRLWLQVRGHPVGRDDLLDAMALLWSAVRLAAGEGHVLPQRPERDSLGLRMEMVY